MNADNSGAGGQQSFSMDSQVNFTTLIQDKSSLTQLFPLIHHIFQSTRIPTFLLYPFMMIFFIQALYVSIWPWAPYWEQSQNAKPIKWIRTILFYMPQPPTSANYFIVSLVFFIFNILSLIFLQIQLSYYKIQRKFINFLNYPIRLYFETLLTSFFVPNLIIIGETFVLLFQGNRSIVVILAFIISIFNEIYMTTTFMVVQYLNSTSIFINLTPLSNFDASFLLVVTIAIHVSILFYFVMSLFEKWSYLVSIVFHLVVNIHSIVILLMNMNIIDITILSTSVGFCFGCITGDIISFITYFHKDISFWYPILGILVSDVVFSTFGLIFFIIRTKTIVKALNVHMESTQDYFDYYDTLKLNIYPERALRYLRIGFEKNCSCFYNMSLLLYIYERYDSEKELRLCVFFANIFPHETYLQSKLQKKLSTLRKLHFVTRFLLFQIDSIKSLRQFSENNLAKLKLVELKNLTRQCEFISKQSIDSKIDAKFLESFASMNLKTKALFKEALINHPNSAKICDEYSRFLIESECDFPEAVKIKHRQNQIELGQSFSTDLCFRYFIKSFPKYLTQEIVDFDGKIIKKIQKEEEVLDSSKLSTKQNTSNEGVLDTDLEDYIARQILKYPRERLALSRLLDSKPPKAIICLKRTIVIILTYVIGICLGGTLYAQSTIQNHINKINELNYISRARFFGALSNVCLLGEYFTEHNAIGYYLEQFSSFLKTTADPHPFILMNESMLPFLRNFTELSSENFDSLINKLSKQSLEGEDIYDYASSLIDINLPQIVFENHCLVNQTNLASLSSIYAQMFAIQRKVSGYNSVMNINIDPDVCELANNFVNLYSGSVILYSQISSNHRKEAEKIKKIFKTYSSIVPIISYLIIDIPIVVLHFMTLKTEKDISQIINSLDKNAKNEAKDNLRSNAIEESAYLPEYHPKSGLRIVLLLLYGFIAFVFLLVILVACFIVMKITDNLVKLNEWNQFSASRQSLAAESLNSLLNCIIMIDVPTSYLPSLYPSFLKLAYFIMEKLRESDNNLILGTNTTDPCVDFDNELDKLNIINENLSQETQSPHEYYQFVSIHQQIQIYINYGENILSEISKTLTFDKTDAANALFLMNYLLLDKTYRASERVLELAINQYDVMFKQMCILAAILLVFVFFFAITCMFYVKNRVRCYNSALKILKRINPYVLLNNTYFNKMFLKGKDIEMEKNNSLESLIIKNANDAIFCTNIHGIIEVANPSVTLLLGYTPDQILGQCISTFFSREYSESIIEKMDQMRNKQSLFYYEDDYSVINDSSRSVPVHCIIIGIRSNISDNVNSFVFIVKNNSILHEQKTVAEQEKAKSEKLLYQILPRDIVLQLNRGEKDISFQVPSASIIFIDIDHFSDYSSNLTPKEIMANLSSYFSVLDSKAMEYKMITKIKLIGDIYMAAGGLFNPDSAPESHANEVVSFGLDILDEMEQINRNLNSNLEVRIGVNNGGPIIAGVLGTDKPLFDIIGDTINVAARLQTSSAVNKVHVSSGIFELLKDMKYDFVKRGETFLKGKGNQVTYYISRPSD